MRNLTKSFVNFSWAMSLFGLEQLTNLFGEERSGNRKERMGNAFDAVTRATTELFGERTRSMYDSGERLQAEMVDLCFDCFRVENWKPAKVMDRAADLAESTADALRDQGGGSPKEVIAEAA